MTLGRNYQRLWSATALSNLADGMFQVALPLLALSITRSPVAIAGVLLAARLPWLVFALQAGALADRLDRRRTMVNVALARFVLIGFLAVIAAANAEQLWILYLVAFALGIGETLFDTAGQSVLPMVVVGDDLSRGNSRLFAAEVSLNRFVGPPVGGLLVGIALSLAFLSSAACYLLAAVAIALMTGRYRARFAGLAPIQAANRDPGRSAGSVEQPSAADPGLTRRRHEPLGDGHGRGVAGVCRSAGTDGAVRVHVRTAARCRRSRERDRGVRVQRWQQKLGRATLLRLGMLAAAATCAAPLLTQPILVAAGLAVAGVGEMCWT